MRYLLDTLVLLWWYLGERRLPRAHLRILEECGRKGETAAVSAISLWEIAWLGAQGRLGEMAVVNGLLDSIESSARLLVLPLDLAVAREAARFGPDFPRDPADRIIGAAALVHGLTLLTADARIRASGAVDVV